MSMNDYAMDMAEDIINDMYNRVSEGEITFDDTQRIYADDLTSEQIESLKFIGIEDDADFRKVIEITGDINE
jgi:hypothetical protein|tara:strand:- start:1015 stop:1230 length:216 start_codon:yes stop_codon:yes gene_type:complete